MVLQRVRTWSLYCAFAVAALTDWALCAVSLVTMRVDGAAPMPAVQIVDTVFIAGMLATLSACAFVLGRAANEDHPSMAIVVITYSATAAALTAYLLHSHGPAPQTVAEVYLLTHFVAPVALTAFGRVIFGCPAAEDKEAAEAAAPGKQGG
jgi:hypothetical protein